jgi:hypothetical protein
MSDTNDRGLARRRLVLIGLDFSSDSQERIVSECIDAWGAAGLLEDVFLVDLGSEVGSVKDFEVAEQFQCARPASDDILTLERVLTSRIWSEITTVSIRLPALARTVLGRVEQEERLKRDVVSAFPLGSECKTGFFTLSWLNDEPFRETVFPQSYNTNLLHDRSIYAGEDLAIAPFDERSRHLSLAFTAMVCAGGFVGQSSGSIMRLVDTDGAMGIDRAVRPIRAIARAASGGWFFRDALRKAMTRDRYIMPGGVVNPIPDGGTPVVVDNLVNQTAEMCEFRYEPYRSATVKARRVGFLQALSHFFRHIWGYIGRSGRRVMAEKVAGAIAPLAELLQSVYSSNSIVVIRGTSASDYGDLNGDVVKLLQVLTQNPNDLGLEPSPKPEIWRDLAQVVTGSLDGSELPKAVTCLNKQGRIIFNDPSIVGPSPKRSVFRLSKSDLMALGVDQSKWIRDPDILFPETVENFRSICTKAKQNVVFGAAKTSMESEVTADSKSTLLRSRLISGTGHSKSGSSSGDGATSWEEQRDARRISEEFESWVVKATDESRSSYLTRLASLIEQEADKAKQDVKVDELKRLVDEIIKETSKRRTSKMLLVAGGLGVGSLLGLFAISQLKLVSLALLPFVIIWFVIWLFSSAIALAVKVFKQAVNDYREDHLKSSESSLQFLFNSTTQAMREYIRLRSLQTQFFAWSQVLREVIHNPYGTQESDAESQSDITGLPHPRQFAIAQVEPSADQMQTLLNAIRRMVLVRGYLDLVLRGVIGVWKERYQKFALQGFNHDPFADVYQTWGQAVYQRVDGTPVFYPLQDFYEGLVHGDLRETAARDLQVEIERKFTDFEVREIFGRVSQVDPEHQALKDFTPEQYLFDYLGSDKFVPKALRQNFNMELFGIQTNDAVKLRQENIDSSMSDGWSPTQRRLGNFGLKRNRRFVMLTFLIALGLRATPRDLAGYQENREDSGSATKWGE